MAFCNDISVRARTWEPRPAPSSLPGDHPLKSGDVVPALVAEVVARRGVADIATFFEPTLRASMPDPSALKGMDEASERFCRAIAAGERIAVFGDYDVDGATSTAMLIRFLRLVGVQDSLFHIPQRMTEGYGPNSPAITSLRERGASLLVIVDSGTGAFEPIAHAVALGMDVIVLDHHEPRDDGALPQAIVINPKRTDEESGLSYLCTAGLAMMFLVAVNRRLRGDGYFSGGRATEPHLPDLFGLVALGTVADMVPLRDLNRAFVKIGLAAMPRIPGIQALMEATGNSECSARTCGFVFGPCINAGGRISDTMQGTRLLITDDMDEAREIASRLHALNLERRQMQKDMEAECIRTLEDIAPGAKAIVLYRPDWHPGVVGLVANKVKDHFDRSAVIIGQDGKGSGRSVEGFNIGRAFLSACELGLIRKGGGHAAAGGLTIDPEKVDAFRKFMLEQAENAERPPARVDLVVPVGTIPPATVEAFGHMAPFGIGASRPRIAFVGGVLSNVSVAKGMHIRAKLIGAQGRADIILFHGIGTPLGEALLSAEGRFVDILGDLDLNTWGGVTTVQIKPDDAMIGPPATSLANAAD